MAFDYLDLEGKLRLRTSSPVLKFSERTSSRLSWHFGIDTIGDLVKHSREEIWLREGD